MAGNILDMLSGLLGGGGAAGMATIPGANSNKMLGALGLGSMGRTTPNAPSMDDMDDMYGELGEEVPEPKPRRGRPAPRMGGQLLSPSSRYKTYETYQQPQPYGELEGPIPPAGTLEPDFGFNPLIDPDSFMEPLPMPNDPFGGEMDNDQRNAIIQLLKLLGR